MVEELDVQPAPASVFCSAILACGIILAMDGLIAMMIGMMIFPPYQKYYERGWYPWRYALKILPLTFLTFLLLTHVLH